MTYEYGQSPMAVLRAENRRLIEKLERTNHLHEAERRKWRKETNQRAKLTAEARNEASEIIRAAWLTAQTISDEADRILTDARQKARQIVLDAENQADHVRERAYDQGLALADRDYLDRKIRQYDLDRARRSTLQKCGVSR